MKHKRGLFDFLKRGGYNKKKHGSVANYVADLEGPEDIKALQPKVTRTKTGKIRKKRKKKHEKWMDVEHNMLRTNYPDRIDRIKKMVPKTTLFERKILTPSGWKQLDEAMGPLNPKTLDKEMEYHAHQAISDADADTVYHPWDDGKDHWTKQEHAAKADRMFKMMPGVHHVTRAMTDHAADQLHDEFHGHAGYSSEKAYKIAKGVAQSIYGKDEHKESTRYQAAQKRKAANAVAKANRPPKPPKVKTKQSPMNAAYPKSYGGETKRFIRGTGSYGHDPRTSRPNGSVDEGKLLDKRTPSISEIAKKHNVSEIWLNKQHQAGIKVEQEHTSDVKVASEIARDHLNEKPDYYIKLKKVEGNS